MLSLINFNAVRFFWRNFNQRRLIGSAFSFIFLLGVFVVSNAPVFAQGPVNGGFEGKVLEKGTGTPLVGAVVQFVNNANGFQTAKRSDQNGNFRQDTLQPGIYLIRVTLSGYKPFERSQELYATRTNALVPVPVELEKEVVAVVTNPDNPPVTTPTPTPTAAPTVIQEEKVSSDTDEGANLNPRRDAAFNAAQVSTLPLGGTTLTRSFDELALLAPGVAPPPQAIGNSVGPGVGGGVGTSGQFAVNGLRSRANNFTVDGSDNNDEDIGVRRQGFFSLVPQPIESIQEFQIITLLAPAQYGRNLGAQVNALSKSGGNEFHGTLFGFANASQLNARNFFDNAGGNRTITLQANRFGTLVDVCFNQPFGSTTCPDANKRSLTNSAGDEDSLTFVQGGFAVGGRIVRNKLFFFASGEGQLLNATNEKHFAVPTVEQRGLFNSGATGLQQCALDANGNCIPNALFVAGFPTSVAGDAVFSLFPFPNDPNGIYGRNTYTQELSADARGRIFSGKVDYNFSRFNNPQTFTARYNYTDDRRDLTDVGGALFSAIRPLVRTDNFSTFLSGGLTDNLSNEIRFSWGRTKLRFDELRDETGFIIPVNSSAADGISNADSRRFLLNARLTLNFTLPPFCSTTGCSAPPFPTYRTFGSTGSFGNTEDTGLGAVGQLIVAGFSPVGVDVFNFPQERVNNTFQIADTLRWQNGNHSLAFGTDIRRTYLNSDLPRNSRPLVTFNGGIIRNSPQISGTSFINPVDLAASNAATGFFQSLVLPNNNAEINLSYNQLNFFVQDDWRIRPNLLINYGLRYELNTTPKEADDKIENTFGIALPSFLSGFSQFIDGRSSIYDSDRNNFAPRVGIAYSPTSDTVIRGGFGMYYDQILGAVVSQSRNVFPTFTTANFGGGQLADNSSRLGSRFTLFNPRDAVFDPFLMFVCNSRDNSPCGINSIPLIQPGTLNTLNPALTPAQLRAALEDIFTFFPGGSGGAFGATLPTRELDTPFSFQYSIGVEQRLRLFGQDSVLSIAYIGTSGRRLLRFTTPNLGSNYIAEFRRVDLNPITGDPIARGITLNPSNGRPVANVGAINQFETTGSSQYDALQIEMRGRLLRSRLQYQASYVFGSVEDDVSDVFDLAGAFALPQNSLTFAGEYAPANFDVRHRFTYSFIYDLPEFNDRGSAFQYLLGGWQIAGTGKFNTGQPFTVNSIFDVNLDGNLTDRLNSTQSITETGDRRQPLRLTGNPLSLLAPIGQDGFVPRNSFRAGSVLDLDLAFVKRFVIREGHTLQFRTDIFNFINRANFGIPVRFLEFPSFGQATDTVTPGRRFQFALKYNF